MDHVSLIQFMRGITTKPRLLGNMLSNIKTRENGWSHFNENLRLMVIKLLKLTQFASPNLSITFILYGVGVRCDRG